MVTIAIVMIVMVAVRDAFAAPSALAVATPFCGCYIRRSSRSSSSSSSSSSSDTVVVAVAVVLAAGVVGVAASSKSNCLVVYLS